jgi:hypothetical protein
MFTNHLQSGYNPDKSLNANDLNVYILLVLVVALVPGISACVPSRPKRSPPFSVHYFSIPRRAEASERRRMGMFGISAGVYV